MKKNRPCILQQSLVGGDSGSSGTCTPNEDFLEDKKKSLCVESSMLLPEDSLNFIAQIGRKE